MNLEDTRRSLAGPFKTLGPRLDAFEAAVRASERANTAELVEAARAEAAALREALEWALEQGGWRLTYYAWPPSLPLALEPPVYTADTARVRTAEEIVTALANISHTASPTEAG